MNTLFNFAQGTVPAKNGAAFLNAANPTEAGLAVIPSYRGGLGPKDIKEIQGKHAKYLELEKKTNIPWKVIAAIDLAGGFKVSAGMAANHLKEALDKHGVQISPSTSRAALFEMLNKAKEGLDPNSTAAKVLNLGAVYYDEITAAFG
ncbi:MAG: hypothetical protein HQM16_04855 [Deltaproteobacteria bacterium]|nr:hypothetical protein [Deltaproteobacteria bacterium]